MRKVFISVGKQHYTRDQSKRFIQSALKITPKELSKSEAIVNEGGGNYN